MRFPRSSGILLHPTSLPGPYGIGDLGDEAYRFVDFLASSGQSLWQTLPLTPPGYGNSPYQSFSAFAGNTLLISPHKLVEEGLLSEGDLEGAPGFSADRIEFGKVIDFKSALLERAYANFKRSADAALKTDFEHFFQFAAVWLDDYALFAALKNEHDGAAWSEWESGLARRDQSAIQSARERLGDKIEAQKFYQYLFFRQWLKLKAYSRERRVRIIGDMPIFVAHNSADVWTHPELFKLDEQGRPVVVAGVPPDAFSKTGQLWGNPIYNWDRMRETGFKWWIDRMASTLQTVDIVRIDHFRGFAATWEVPAQDETAEGGQWVEVPGRELFDAMKNSFERLPIVAEDLGTITPDVHALRDELGFPGMRVLQFAFSADNRDMHLPHMFIPNAVAYTGTHDNDTTVGWFNREPPEDNPEEAEQIERERAYALKYLKTDGTEIHWDLIGAAFASVADMAIIPLQDALGLDSSARMNLPASEEGNWGWRFQPGALTDDLSARLKDLTMTYGRDLRE